jgi:hypothetical protein
MQQSGGCDWIAGRTSWDTKLPLTHLTSLYFAQKPLLYKIGWQLGRSSSFAEAIWGNSG